MGEDFLPPSVVVGVDGSRAAVRAALWAIDEAVSRDMPLRLVTAGQHAAESSGDQPPAGTAAARAVADTVRATRRPVRVDIDVVSGTPVEVLVEASRTAAMVCVGAIGIHHFEHDRIGSTATALAALAHCPVAIVRGTDRPAPAQPGSVVVHLDQGPDSAAVLQFAVDEARLREAPLRVLGSWQSHGADSTPAPEGNRMVHAQLDRRLAQWRHRYPDLDVQPVAVHGTVLDYLAENAAAVQLMVIGSRNTPVVGELLSPSGLTTLGGDCSIVVVDPQRLL